MTDTKPTIEELKVEAAKIVPYKIGSGQAVIQKRIKVYKDLLREHGYPTDVPTTKRNYNGKRSVSYQHPRNDSR